MQEETREVYILYGSQTGNAEFIAQDLAEKFKAENLPNRCMPLNAAKKLSLTESASFIVFICSTTGNGDAPENAEAWWRSMRLRSVAKDKFLGMHYAVLGLGDTNYDQFCHMGKVIDKRITDLGGIRALELHCADEATGLEETVEKWKKIIIPTVKKTLTKDTDNTPTAEEKTATKDIIDRETSVETKNIEAESVDDMIHVSVKPPDGLQTLAQIATLNKLEDELSRAVETNQIPRVKSCGGAEPSILPSSNNSTIFKFSATNNELDGEQWTAEHPFMAKVASARWLTSNLDAATINAEGSPNGLPWGETKRVVHLDINLSGSNISYTPGDSIAICCPNPSYAVDIVLRRLQTAHPDQQLTRESVISGMLNESDATLEELLSYKYDLMGPPRKAIVATFAQFCKDPMECQYMQHLCSKSSAGKKLWSQFIDQQRLGVAELLLLFPSCTPTLQQLFCCLTCLPPRYYSIASSPLDDPDRASVAFSIVRQPCQVSIPHAGAQPVIKRQGICTTYLETILRPWLYPKSGVENCASFDVPIRVFHKPSMTFHLPGKVSIPLILIGPGTGVAPFKGFLDHRFQLEKRRHSKTGDDCVCSGIWHGGFELSEEDLPGEHSGVKGFIRSVEPGPINLFFGCRNEHDFLYKSELQTHVVNGTLTSLEVAMSRVSESKVYVTHKIRDRGEEVASLLMYQDAYIFICGDGNHMAKDVHSVLKEILEVHGGMDDEASEEFLQEMKTRRRYLLDIWS